MKHAIILFLNLLLTATSINAKVIDSANVAVMYSLEYVKDLELADRARHDEMLLIIGDKIASQYSYICFRADSLRKANPAEYAPQVVNIDGTTTTIPAKTRVPRSLNREVLFINRDDGSLIYLGIVFDISYQYSEQLTKPTWKITNEADSILRYPCQKATTQYGGRVWTVWFTSEIPVSEGPWLLRGLPGLILKAEDSEGHYKFLCTGVERLNAKKAIELDTGNKYRKITKKGAYEMEKAFFEDLASAMRIYSNVPIKSIGNERKYKYNPIERLE